MWGLNQRGYIIFAVLGDHTWAKYLHNPYRLGVLQCGDKISYGYITHAHVNLIFLDVGRERKRKSHTFLGGGVICTHGIFNFFPPHDLRKKKSTRDSAQKKIRDLRLTLLDSTMLSLSHIISHKCHLHSDAYSCTAVQAKTLSFSGEGLWA